MGVQQRISDAGTPHRRAALRSDAPSSADLQLRARTAGAFLNRTVPAGADILSHAVWLSCVSFGTFPRRDGRMCRSFFSFFIRCSSGLSRLSRQPENHVASTNGRRCRTASFRRLMSHAGRYCPHFVPSRCGSGQFGKGAPGRGNDLRAADKPCPDKPCSGGPGVCGQSTLYSGTEKAFVR